ncbi:MAG: PKD domain-containing protein [Saprospiraceae bacterium]
MKYFFILIFSLSLWISSTEIGHAEHLVGGVLSYTCLGNGTIANTKNYRFKLNLKRDCKQGNTFDANVDIGIYQFNGTQYFFNRKINVPISTERTVPLNQQSCITLLYGVCVDEAIYQFDILNLPVINENYLIAFQRCCRNMTISNILDPGRTGSTIMLEITPEAQLVCNQGPTSDILPPLVVCANEDLKLDLGSTDSEGDMLMYELCAPLTGGGPQGLGGTAGDPLGCNGISPDPSRCVPALKEVTFANSSINATNPFPSSTPISLTNGILSARPNSLGQYIFGVCIKEFRNGKLLSTSRRDIQINIAQCNINIQALITADKISNKIAELTICDPSSNVTIINQSKDSQYIKSVFWEFLSPKNVRFTDTTFNFTKKFSDTGLYIGKMVLNKGSMCADSIMIRLRSSNAEKYIINAVYDSCALKPVQFSISPNPASPFDSIQWDFGDSISLMNTLNPLHSYTKPGLYTVKVNTLSAQKCKSSASAVLNFFPSPPTLTLSFKDSVFCYPQQITLGVNEITDPKYQYAWTLSDGQQFSGNAPKLTFNKPGVYMLKLLLTSPNGCKLNKDFNRTLFSYEKPKAAFDVVNPDLTFKNPLLQVSNNSVKAKTYLWDFGDHTSSTLLNPEHTYLNIGRYKVTLHVTSDNGCLDSITYLINVGSSADLYVPNIFTPNADGNNDIFVPIGIIGILSSYEFSIFDRWGSLVFFTRNLNEGWDGNNQKNINLAATEGVYVYQIRYITEDGVVRIAKGSVTLIR